MDPRLKKIPGLKKILALKKMLVIFLTFFTVLTCYATANAYVLPGPYILELAAEKSGKVKKLFISQKVFLYNTGIMDETIEAEEIIRCMPPDVFRSDISSETGDKIFVESSGQNITIIDDEITTDNVQTLFDHYIYILLCRYPVYFQEKLSLLGIDVSISSLGRFQDKIAYVLGAQYPEKTPPQLWIEKNTFRPLRLIPANKNGQKLNVPFEIRYNMWQQTDGFWYPMHIEFYQNNILAREIHVDKIKVNPFFPEDLFDIEHLKSIHLPSEPAKQQGFESKELEDVQKTIEEFRKIFE